MKDQKQAIRTDYSEIFIEGQWVKPVIQTTFEIRSPHDQSLVGSIALGGNEDIDLAVKSARAALDGGPWSKMSPEERQDIVERFDQLHSQYTDELAVLITNENGSPIWFTSFLQKLMTQQNSTYLRAARSIDWEVRQTTFSGANRILRREPVGVVAAVIPWNVPQQSALTKIIPALLAGCSVIFKPVPQTALDGLFLAELFREAGLPDGVLNIVPAERGVSEYLVGHPGVDKISFTGSAAAGKRIAAIAGAQMKRFSMELGGKSAAIILNDADIPFTVSKLKLISFLNSGESCLAHTRVLAPRSQYAEITEALAHMVSDISVGRPDDPANFIGPMVNKQHFDKVNSYLELGLREGARIVAGGQGGHVDPALKDGWYIRPTLFTDVKNNMRIAREEIFGPVLVVIPYENVAEAIAIANDSPYGLAGSVWTQDTEKGIEVARQIKTGTFSINGVNKDFESPFGGYKQSGVGRECGAFGIEEYIELKSIAL